jgi:hypothetical protein
MTSVSDLYECTEYSSDAENESHALGEYKSRVPEAVQRLAEERGHDPLPQEGLEAQFLNRKPGMGLERADIAALKAFDAARGTLRRDRQKIFRVLRFRMLRMCVDCDGASTVSALAEALEREINAGAASPLPSWYRFKNPEDPLETLGLKRCCARDCHRVESEDLKMKKCAKCIAPNAVLLGGEAGVFSCIQHALL